MRRAMTCVYWEPTRTADDKALKVRSIGLAIEASENGLLAVAICAWLRLKLSNRGRFVG
jgi:hypothetical protein